MNAAKLYATAATVVFLLVAGPAGADNVNLVANGTFEGSVAGWRAENATLTLAGPGAVGTGAAQVSLTGPATSYYLYPTPRPVGSTVAGATYTAGAFVRSSFLGRRLCLRLREWSPSGAAVGAFSTCLKSNRGWQRFNPISWRARSDGNELEVYAYGVDARRGDSFLVDEIMLQTTAATLPAAPTNTVPPSLSGTARAGETLTASTGVWSGTQPIAYAFQWRRCDSAGGACSSVAGATAATYRVAATDVGTTLRVEVAARNPAGSSSAASAATGIVRAAPAPSGPVVWSAGMEAGNLAEWTESWDSGLCSRPPNGVSTAYAHSGRYSMAMTIDTSQGDAGCRQARTPESRSGRPYYYGAWLYIPTHTRATNYWNVVQFKSKRTGASGSDPFWVVDLMPRSTGALALRLRWKGMVAGPFAGDGTARRTWSHELMDVPVGRWFHVEIYLRQSGAYDGRITVWQDGVQLWDLDAVKTRYDDGDMRWTVNNYSDGLAPSPATLYVDDTTIAEGRVYSG